MAAGIGDTLRATRRQQRLSLAEAAAEIRVREPYLAALEDEKFAKLGGDVYVRAFLRGYSEFLGLDPDQVVEAYRREHERSAGARSRPELPADADAPTTALAPTTATIATWDEVDEVDEIDDEPRTSFFPRAVVLAGVVLLLLVVAVLGLRQRDDGLASGDITEPSESAVVIPTSEAEAVVPSAEPTVAETAEAVPQPPPPPPPTPSPTPPPPQGPLTEINVELRVTDGPSWLRASVDGSVVEMEIFPPGTTFAWTADESLALRVGDASNVRIVLNGVDQGVLGGEREPVDIEYRIGEPA